MEAFRSEEEYIREINKRAVLPAGFRTGASELTFFPSEKKTDKPYKMNISALVLDEPTDSFAAVFTRNRFPGVPVILGKRMLERPFCRGIFCNNRIANVCAPEGESRALDVLNVFSSLAGGNAADYFNASTGVIGWGLPVAEMRHAVPALVGALQKDSIFPLARAIMTTDSFVKVRSAGFDGARITATAKGAGMIEPNMATMFSFVLTDADIPGEKLRKMLPAIADETFNCISVDSDQSTSDMLVILSSGKFKVNLNVFEEQLYAVCKKLSGDIVRNGEGTAHVIRLVVSGARDVAQARTAGKHIINSPLVKTAVFGNDPNVGRVIMAIGDWAGNGGIDVDPLNVIVSLGGKTVFRKGVFDLGQKKEKELSAYLKACMLDTERKGYPEHDRTVELSVDLGLGKARAESIGSDLSYEYVRENAEYTS
ncbi:MAG: bifunctional ornithine acetyltransferase/N-acetylglutamate synthase [Spirochaetales bacterium]|nr:bifunctional ornithine acetyltransferase/N-acetylglutamate synthase [Spirochaetales bacterium]